MPPSVVSSSSMGLGSGIIGRERPLIVGSTAFGQHSFRQPQQQQATSLDSKLNSGAGAVPAVTVTQIPSDVIMTKIPLKRKWTFWHDKFVANATPASYTENLKTVAEADTVQSFWSVYNNTAGPEKLALRCSLHFMHKGFEDTIAPGDEIFGLSVSARWNSDIFQIWNMASSLKESSAVMDKVTAILANVDSLKDVEIQSPFYKAHKDHDHFNK
ncbi:hypothetical protein BGZ90_005194 [Linnemannia elongata]|nr:hypothetical protein BGZ90_005194 [Linnemannia elongata]